MRMKDRVALVTGAGGPMGMAVAKRFAEEGASLVITDISAARLAEGERAVAEAAGSAGKVVALRTNAMVRGEVEELVAAGRQKFGAIQILANIVGGYQGQHYEGPADLVHMTEARWDATMQLNLKPGFHLVQLLAPAMLEDGYGKILNISSINFAGEAGSADYGAAKAGVASLTRTLAMELAPHVNVNAIAPGIIRTRVLAMLGPENAEIYKERSLLKRLGEPTDIANTALFLCSDEGGYITGEILPVSGGIWPAL
ncbi:MAG: SDR family oxidoreductase [Rhodospirillaceae bacterium]|jgi:3-oxoacyl-[acyl-carrier protein] reductase|nr:SDR family oxidoreductase [Rhodospirillaceae bacterium]MBT6427311.1 SDR family oxidoreductase [Rhodospirillaceae bacterium]MBT7757174.1 SDR family oxidoreductase [Rhodospirillaceae bacterium]